MNKKYPGKERRQFKRAKVNFIVIYKVNAPLFIRMMVGDKEVDAIAMDVSEGGMAVLTKYELPPLAIVGVRFVMINEKAIGSAERRKTIAVNGEVRYSVLTEENAYRIGISFMDMSEKERKFMANFVRLQEVNRPY